MSSRRRDGGVPQEAAHAAHRRTLDADAERRRQLARVLHEGVQQQLVLALLTVQLARDAPATLPARTSELLAEASTHVQEAIDGLRDVVNAIHPMIVDSLGLIAAVESLLERTGVPATVTGTTTHRIAPTIESNAYFLVAEAVSNAVTHSCAAHIHVHITGDATRLVVEVSDDGAKSTDPEGGRRLASPADAIAALDGTLTRQSGTGLGTTVRAVYPISTDTLPNQT